MPELKSIYGFAEANNRNDRLRRTSWGPPIRKNWKEMILQDYALGCTCFWPMGGGTREERMREDDDDGAAREAKQHCVFLTEPAVG